MASSEQFKIRFLPADTETCVDAGTTVLEAARAAGVNIPAFCGGEGSCGKCQVVIDGKSVLACGAVVDRDLTVEVMRASRRENLLADGAGRSLPLRPYAAGVKVIYPKLEVGEYEDDARRISHMVEEALCLEAPPRMSLEALREAEMLIAQSCREFFVVLAGAEIVHAAKDEPRVCMVAFDVGTTSLVGYLLDSADGSQLAVASRINPQGAYGADVITRANYAVQEDPDKLTSLIREALDAMVGELCEASGVDRRDIYAICVVGNTTMHHLFHHICPGSLLSVPYNAAITEAIELPASHVGVHAGPGARVLSLPLFTGFVGADTCACLLACDFAHVEKLTVMIDIGTNGEIVVGNSQGALASSTAAGPALEGAKITFGMRGATGAIDHVTVVGEDLVFSVIGGGRAEGICGSGLIDLVAVMAEHGMLQKTGRFVKAEKLESPLAKANAWRFGRDDDGAYFNLVDGVRLYQKDVSEVQLAKSAICVGVRMLCSKLGWQIDDVEQVLVAGAFGNYMNPDSACRIGLIPSELKGKVRGMGNAAGEGAKIALLCRSEIDEAKRLASKIPFVELASEPDFMNSFMKGLNL